MPFAYLYYGDRFSAGEVCFVSVRESVFGTDLTKQELGHSGGVGALTQGQERLSWEKKRKK